jgi:hypothetical protein
VSERLKIDKALVAGRPPLADDKAVYDHFDLAGRYGIGWEPFHQYARETLKAHTTGYTDRLRGELLAESDPSDREQPLDLMTDRLAKRITEILSRRKIKAPELARLSSSAASLRRAAMQAETDRVRRELLRAKLNEMIRAAEEVGQTSAALSKKLRRAIREIYGIDTEAEGEEPKETGPFNPAPTDDASSTGG